MKAWLFGMPILCAVIVTALPINLNTTESEPLGFYWITPRISPYVSVCLPPQEEAHALALGVSAAHGSCPGGRQPLLKQWFIATPRHPVIFSAAGFAIDGKLLPNTAPLSRAANGRPLIAIPFQTYTHGLFTISTHHPRSYDSRYFGPVDPRNVVGFARPLLVFR